MTFSALILPALIFLLIIWALFKRVNVYDAFVRGAADSLPMLVQILPFMAAMLIALNIFRASGALNVLVQACAPALEAIGMPAELTPLFVLRPFSGSAALALLQDVFNNYGVDSMTGLIASVMVGSTETIFYTVALYYGSVKVLKTRHSVPVALISGLAGAVAAVLLSKISWGG